MEEDKYKNLITEIINKQVDILGPDIAVQKANNVQGLKVDDAGSVLELSGDPGQVLQQLVDEYMNLSGAIVKNILSPVLAKYPDIKLKLEQS